ncbi:MAG: hypothetical protein A2W99_10260 [Bacteroidetes bacterium GWF2_33_16]|nr:MAG: hypothetical protein A2X00_05480 [Bacteroidetes bacterium GWE2_32_14]OFY03931.1 MAG: hypothetical protein A2W99_10260 [Bacteroidetes bacterium GWF2_33_16]
MKFKKYILLFITIISFGYSAHAGWIITQRTYDSDEGIAMASVETVYLQDNIMKVTHKDIITIFDLNKELITLISPAKNVYWTGNITTYKTDMKSGLKQVMDEQLKAVAPEQREMMKKMFEGMIAAVDDPSKAIENKPKNYSLEIKKTKESARIAGYSAVKYQVLVNGALKEEAWLSESSRAHDEFDIYKFYGLFSDFTAQSGTMEYYQMHEKYLEFARKGFPLKSVNYYGGYETISEVTKLDKEKIDLSVFAVPDGYRKASLMEIGLTTEPNE